MELKNSRVQIPNEAYRGLSLKEKINIKSLDRRVGKRACIHLQNNPENSCRSCRFDIPPCEGDRIVSAVDKLIGAEL